MGSFAPEARMPCPPEDAHLTPDQRRREIAAILARGVLRLRHIAPNDARDLPEKPLELFAPSRPHVTRG